MGWVQPRQERVSKIEVRVVVALLKFRVSTKAPAATPGNEKYMFLRGKQPETSTNFTVLAVQSVKSAFLILTAGEKRIMGTTCPFRFSDFDFAASKPREFMM